MACGINFIVKREGRFTGIQVHWKSGNILETLLYRNVVQQATNGK